MAENKTPRKALRTGPIDSQPEDTEESAIEKVGKELEKQNKSAKKKDTKETIKTKVSKGGAAKDAAKKFDDTVSFKTATDKMSKSFSETVGNIKGFMKPGNLIRTAGLGMNSPLVMMMGDKVNSMTDAVAGSLKDNNKVIETGQEDEVEAVKEVQEDSKPTEFENSLLKINEDQFEVLKKLGIAWDAVDENFGKSEDFNQEQNDEENKAIQLRQADALEDIANQKDPEVPKGQGFWGWLLSLMGLGAGGGIVSTIKNMFGKGFDKFLKPFRWIAAKFGLVSKKVGTHAESLGPMAKKAGALGKYFGFAAKLLGKIVMSLMIVWELYKGLTSEGSIEDKLKSAAAGVLSLFTELPATLLNWVGSLFGFELNLDGSKEAILGFINGSFTKIVTGIGEWIDKIPGYLMSAFTTVMNIGKFIKEKFQSAVDFLSGDASITDKFIGTIKNVWGLIPKAIWSLLESFAPEKALSIGNWASDMKDTLMNWAFDLVYSIAPASWGIKSLIGKALSSYGWNAPGSEERIKLDQKNTMPTTQDQMNTKAVKWDKPGEAKSIINAPSNVTNNLATEDLGWQNDDRSYQNAVGGF
jgi:hypothetical protein